MASRVFIVRGQGGLYSSVFRNNGYIGIGFFKNDPFKEKWDLSSKEFLVKEYRKWKLRFYSPHLTCKSSPQ